uniref:Uncharacterized protein n=1 Tax=Arundo donax TaxID=35708 RepID=A0A0A8YV51_ARUDO
MDTVQGVGDPAELDDPLSNNDS